MTIAYNVTDDRSSIIFGANYKLRNTPELENHILSNPDIFHHDPDLDVFFEDEYEFTSDARLAKYTDIIRSYLPNIPAALRVCYLNFISGAKYYDLVPDTLGAYLNARRSSYYHDPHIAYRLDGLIRTYDINTTVGELFISPIFAPEDYIPINDYAISRVKSGTYKSLDNLLDIPALFVHAYVEVFGFLPSADVAIERYHYCLKRYIEHGRS